MSLESFKELLLKKTAGNKDLSVFVQYMGDEFLTTHIVESLEKMARTTENMGHAANAAVTTYAGHMDDSDVHQLRDALSHHVSHYKAALKAFHAAPTTPSPTGKTIDSPERRKMRQVADQHLNHLIPLMHLASKAEKHSGGKVALDYPELPMWEANYTSLKRSSTGSGKFHHDTKKLGRRPSPGAAKWSPEKPHATGVPDYHYLEMPPHPGHEHYEKYPHEGGYPWEEVRLGSPKDVDGGQGYLHIEDVPDKKEYTPHPFDFHPVREVQDIPDHHFSPERLDKFRSDFENWKVGDRHMKWLEDQEKAEQADPEGFSKRGTVKPSHVYEGMPLLEQPGHINDYPKRTKKIGDPSKGKEAAPVATAAPAVSPKATAAPSGHQLSPEMQAIAADPKMSVQEKLAAMKAIASKQGAPQPAKSSAVAPTIRRAAPSEAAPQAATPNPMDKVYEHYLKADPEMKELLFHQNPNFMAYLKTRKGDK